MTAKPTQDHKGRLVQVRDLWHTFDSGAAPQPVLQGIDLDLFPGQIMVLTGPSGSGKTTLLTLIGGLRSVQQGQVKVLGRPLQGCRQRELVQSRRSIGFIFQAHNLFGALTALQNVCLALELHSLPGAEKHRRAESALCRLGLGDRLHYYPQALSGGQRQRVAIARALVHQPELILADEPTAALDGASASGVVGVFQEMTENERTGIILVTHDPTLHCIADDVVSLRAGRIVTGGAAFDRIPAADVSAAL